MRILHTADWHLGRIFHEVHLTGAQTYLLEQCIQYAAEFKPDVLLITGDVYDRAVPPPEAVRLLDDTLYKLAHTVSCKVIMIAGNHDSPDRLSFGSRLMTDRGIQIYGNINVSLTPIIINDTFGPVYFYVVPYAEPSVVREIFGTKTIHNHQDSFDAIVNTIQANHPQGERSVLCAHASVLGSTASDSERPLSIGGSELVDKSLFHFFSYTALGHLHNRQWPSKSIHYPGSLMKYSFSEVSHQKSISLIELDKTGVAKFEYLPLTPLRDLRIVKGMLSDILTSARQDTHREDYIMAVLENPEPQLDAIGKLRQVYPNILHIERPRLFLSHDKKTEFIDHRALSDTQLFNTFFEQTTGKPVSEEQMSVLKSLIDTVRQQEREAL